MDKVSKHKLAIFLIAIICMACISGSGTSKTQRNNGITVYATRWQKNTFRPLGISEMESDIFFVEAIAKDVPKDLSILIEGIKFKKKSVYPNLNLRVLLFIGTDTIMISKDCTLRLNSNTYELDCCEINRILEATRSYRLLDVVDFPIALYSCDE